MLHTVFLTLQNLSYEKGAEKGAEIQERQEELVKILLKYSSITRQELMNETGLSRRKIQNDIKSLKEQGRIRRVGSDRKGYWEVND